jgi:large subunit ribosomal protein L12
MEYVYAALLLHKLNQEINEENIKNVVKSAGATPNDVMVKALVAALSEVNIDEALKAAAPVLTPSSATAGTVSGSTTSAGQGSPTASKADEEKKEEKKEEEALEGLSALFG